MLCRTARPFTEEIDKFPFRSALMTSNYGLPRGASEEEQEFKRMFGIEMIVYISLASRSYHAGRRIELHRASSAAAKDGAEGKAGFTAESGRTTKVSRKAKTGRV